MACFYLEPGFSRFQRLIRNHPDEFRAALFPFGSWQMKNYLLKRAFYFSS